MNLLTIIILIVFAIAGLRGYRRGFVKSLASIASIALSVLLVNLAQPYVADYLKTQTPLPEYLEKRCEEAFPLADGAEKLQLSIGEITQGVGSLQQMEWIDALPLPPSLKNILKENNTQQSYEGLSVSNFTQYVPKYLAGIALNAISFLVAWLLVILAIWLAMRALGILAKLPVLSGVNHVLGLALGLVQGLAIVWVSFLVITLCMHTDAGRRLMAMIAESPLLNFLYEKNILLGFLTNLLGNIG